MTWMEGQFALSFYQAFLTLLVWLLATLACLGAVASLVMVCFECMSFFRPASLVPEAHTDIDFKTRDGSCVPQETFGILPDEMR